MTSNMVMILAGILERLRYSFPEANPEIVQKAKVNNILRPVREQLEQLIKKANANPEIEQIAKVNDVLRQVREQLEQLVEKAAANPEIEKTAKINNILRPVREQLEQLIKKADANPEIEQTAKVNNILRRVREQLEQLIEKAAANPEIEQTAKVNNILRSVHERLKQFIEKADANPDLANALAKMKGTEIMTLAHSFEDSLELYMLGFKSRKNGSTNEINYGVNEKSLRDAGRKLSQACNFSIASLINLADEISSGSACPLYSYESDMVGMVDAEDDLVAALTQGTEHLKLVSICGMPGIGKTTLALNIYDDPEIEQHFEVRAWVSVSQHMDRRDILLKIHYGVDSDAESDEGHLPEDALAECVRKYLKGKSYLVVLDDVPDADAWFCLRNCFPDNEKGSRILITTQMKDAGILVGGPEPHIHTMRLLTDEESSDLLRSSLKEEEIEKFGKNIKSASGGLPSAIVTLASSVKENPSKQWEWHLENLYRGSRDNSLFNVLDLSYRSLPIQLRACLLYLANYFTELAEIEMDTVCQLLIAEGLVLVEDKKNNGETMMDVAALYLDELDNRCLIQILDEEEVEEQNEDVQPGERRFMSCRIHKVTGGFCKSKENNHGFVEAIDLQDENQGSISSTRVGIFLHENEYNYAFLSEKAKLIRSLLILNLSPSPPGNLGSREIPNPENFIRLRVLYLYAVDLKNGKLPKGMENLVHLRYLSFRDCYLEELCSSVSNMFYLQTLDLRVRNEGQVVTIPDHNVLNGLERLRYLYLPPAYRTPNGGKLQLGRVKELELLDNFDASFCCVGDLLNMPNLMWVTVTTMGHVDEIETILSFIWKNSGILRSMSLNLRDYDCYSGERLSTLGEVFYSISLHTLNIKGHIKELPMFTVSGMTPSDLTKIVLNGSELVEDPMKSLQLLPSLKILVLETEAYNGTEMKCASSSFLELRCLKLSKLYKLEDWQVEDQAMPKLSTLIIEECKNLKMLPEGLRFLSNLRKLEIMSMPDAFVGRIQKPDQTEGEDFYKIKHVQPNVKVNGQILILKERCQGQIVQVAQESEDAKLVVISQIGDPYYGNWDQEYLS